MTPAAAKLPIAVDVAGLRTDLARIAATDWLPHFNTAYYEGDWSVAPLRSTGGRADQIYPDPTATDFADTPLLARCPAVAALLAQLSAPKLSVRFLRLGAGAQIKEHADLNLGLEDGEVRLHTPVTSNPAVTFLLDGHELAMHEGELWYLNLNLKHAVRNDGDAPRVHLVIDCVVDEALRAMVLSDRYLQ